MWRKGGDRAFLEGLHSTTAAEATVDVWKATACGAPWGPSASQQSDGGFKVGGAQGLGFLLHCQENDLLGHRCRLSPWHSPFLIGIRQSRHTQSDWSYSRYLCLYHFCQFYLSLGCYLIAENYCTGQDLRIHVVWQKQMTVARFCFMAQIKTLDI